MLLFLFTTRFGRQCWQLKLQWFLFLLREAEFRTFGLLACFQLGISNLLVIYFHYELHGREDGKLRHGVLHAHLMLLVIQVDVFQGTIVNLLVDFVHKLQLVTLQLVACQHFYSLILADQLKNFLRHRHVALNKV